MKQDLSEAVVAALWQGNKLEAIKLLRGERRIGLKEAKETVEQYVKAEPALQNKLSAAQADAMRTFVRWLCVIVVLALAASYFVLGK